MCSPASPDDTGAERAARWAVRLVALALVAAVAAVTAVWLRDGVDGGAVSPATTDAAPETIGPLPESDVDFYIARRRDAFAAATGVRVAVVSLVSFRSGAAALDVLADPGVPLEHLLLFVAVPGEAPSVTDDLEAWIGEARNRVAADRAEIESLLPDVAEPSFRTFYLRELDRLDRVGASLATVEGAEVVFGLLVRGSVDALVELAAEAEVRLVDVGSSATPPGDDQVRALLPDEVTRVGDPPTRPP